jgi:hypothetical protein
VPHFWQVLPEVGFSSDHEEKGPSTSQGLIGKSRVSLYAVFSPLLDPQHPLPQFLLALLSHFIPSFPLQQDSAILPSFMLDAASFPAQQGLSSLPAQQEAISFPSCARMQEAWASFESDLAILSQQAHLAFPDVLWSVVDGVLCVAVWAQETTVRARIIDINLYFIDFSL